jgi:NAD(P)-dependent dehydrogenase (short-subunit alcohol dehydrogenase family)
MSKVWFITGSGSGIGAGTAKAALEVLTASPVWLRALVAEITPN